MESLDDSIDRPCIDCGREKEMPRRKRCLACITTKSLRDLDINRKYSAAAHQRAREAGNCMICHRRPAREGKVTCSACALKQQQYYEKTRRRAPLRTPYHVGDELLPQRLSLNCTCMCGRDHTQHDTELHGESGFTPPLMNPTHGASPLPCVPGLKDSALG
jgi:hypothetical protein